MTPSYALGLAFILLVVLIWTFASILVQYLYQHQDFDSPFLLTYIGTALFIVLLPSQLLWERRKSVCRQSACCAHGDINNNNSNGNAGHDGHTPPVEIIPWRTAAEEEGYQPVHQDSFCFETANYHDDGRGDDDSDENDSSDDECVGPSFERDHSNDTNGTDQHGQHRLLSHQQHFAIALRIAPMWFLANWTYNASLKLTSITSSTVLASTGSLFTLLFAVVSGDELFTYWKLIGVLLGVNGSVFVAWNDYDGGNTTGVSNVTDAIGFNTTMINDTDMSTLSSVEVTSETALLLGDLLGLLSAIGYGVYAVLVRVLCPHDESRYSMQLMLGYVGLINGVALLPVVIYIMVLSDAATTLTQTVFGCLIIKGLLDNVLSDYLWARAVILTSATVATVGLGFTIPLAFVSDIVLGNGSVVTIKSAIGALSVLGGFLIVNTEANKESTQTMDGDDEAGIVDWRDHDEQP